jgi:hypothetical protein
MPSNTAQGKRKEAVEEESIDMDDELAFPTFHTDQKMLANMDAKAPAADDSNEFANYDDNFEQTDEYPDDFDFEQTIEKATLNASAGEHEVAVAIAAEEEGGEKAVVDSDLEDFPQMADVVDDLESMEKEQDLLDFLPPLEADEEAVEIEDQKQGSQEDLNLDGNVANALSASAAAMSHASGDASQDVKLAPAVTFIETGDDSSSSDGDSDSGEHTIPSRIPVFVVSPVKKQQKPSPDLAGFRIPLSVASPTKKDKDKQKPTTSSATTIDPDGFDVSFTEAVSEASIGAAADPASDSESSSSEEEEEAKSSMPTTTLMGWTLPTKKTQQPAAVAADITFSAGDNAVGDSGESLSSEAEEEEEEEAMRQAANVSANADGAELSADTVVLPPAKVPGKRKPNIGLSAMLAADTDEEEENSPSARFAASTPPREYQQAPSATTVGGNKEIVFGGSNDVGGDAESASNDFDFGDEDGKNKVEDREDESMSIMSQRREWVRMPPFVPLQVAKATLTPSQTPSETVLMYLECSLANLMALTTINPSAGRFFGREPTGG